MERQWRLQNGGGCKSGLSRPSYTKFLPFGQACETDYKINTEAAPMHTCSCSIRASIPSSQAGISVDFKSALLKSLVFVSAHIDIFNAISITINDTLASSQVEIRYLLKARNKRLCIYQITAAINTN